LSLWGVIFAPYFSTSVTVNGDGIAKSVERIGYRLETEESGCDSRKEREIFLFSMASIPALRSTEPHIQWRAGLLPGNTAAGEADNSRPSSTEVKNGGAIPPLTPYVSKVLCFINRARR
jgi:hypothetical protein